MICNLQLTSSIIQITRKSQSIWLALFIVVERVIKLDEFQCLEFRIHTSAYRQYIVYVDQSTTTWLEHFKNEKILHSLSYFLDAHWNLPSLNSTFPSFLVLSHASIFSFVSIFQNGFSYMNQVNIFFKTINLITLKIEGLIPC